MKLKRKLVFLLIPTLPFISSCETYVTTDNGYMQKTHVYHADGGEEHLEVIRVQGTVKYDRTTAEQKLAMEENYYVKFTDLEGNEIARVFKDKDGKVWIPVYRDEDHSSRRVKKYPADKVKYNSDGGIEITSRDGNFIVKMNRSGKERDVYEIQKDGSHKKLQLRFRNFKDRESGQNFDRYDAVGYLEESHSMKAPSIKAGADDEVNVTVTLANAPKNISGTACLRVATQKVAHVECEKVQIVDGRTIFTKKSMDFTKFKDAEPSDVHATATLTLQGVEGVLTGTIENGDLTVHDKSSRITAQGSGAAHFALKAEAGAALDAQKLNQAPAEGEARRISSRIDPRSLDATILSQDPLVTPVTQVGL